VLPGLSHRLVQQRRRLHEMARTDQLTGCLNRRGFDERLAGVVAVTPASSGEYALIALITTLEQRISRPLPTQCAAQAAPERCA
jgi:GGDEF domain-containing protein